jgi:putative AlgH/UPF0301 family transcriptional regulator
MVLYEARTFRSIKGVIELTEKKKTVKKIVCKGPVDENNGALIFRFPREKKGDLDIYRGQVLSVGEEITEQEAAELLNATSWNFEEATE